MSDTVPIFWKIYTDYVIDYVIAVVLVTRAWKGCYLEFNTNDLLGVYFITTAEVFDLIAVRHWHVTRQHGGVATLFFF